MFIAVEWWDGMNNRGGMAGWNEQQRRDGMNYSGGMAGLEKSILDPKRRLIACTMDIYSIRDFWHS